MKTNAKAMVLASFAADALALGVHWIYDTRQIDEKFGRVRDFVTPAPSSYHSTKQQGDFTHYGDQTLLLLRSVSECGGFDGSNFGRAWREFFQTYTGYVDGATRQTLKNLEAGAEMIRAGSASEDLAGAARIAPLVYCYQTDLDRLVASVRQQTDFTHRTAAVVASAEFFGRTAWYVLDGQRPTAAMTRAADETGGGDSIAGWVQAGLKSATEDSRSAIRRFGQMCAVAAAFPATVHLIAKFEDRLEQGLIENVMAGGDSAGRGLLVGLVLGAHGGQDALPERWDQALNARPQIERMLAQLDQSIRDCAAASNYRRQDIR